MKSTTISSSLKQDRVVGAQEGGEIREGSESGAEGKAVGKAKVVVEADGEGHGDGERESE